MDQYSADSLRFLLLSSPVLSGEDFALLDKDVSDVNRKLAMVWNVYDFFTTYAEIEGWESPEAPGNFGTGKIADLKNPLDRWILARLYETRRQIIDGMAEYNIPKALEGVLLFIDDLSNWFVRRSRRRFNKNDDAEDKKEAFWTLWKVLEKTAVMLAPFTPFLAEELWQKLVGNWDKEKSVHLLNYPTTTEIDDKFILADMARTRQIITDALSLRMQKSEIEQQIKIRQPLAKLTYDGDKLDEFYEQIIADEVNVKKVEHSDKLTLDKTLTPELLEEGKARDIIRAIQATRKHAGLQVDDQIKLSLSIDLPKGYEDLIKFEVNATEITKNQNYSHDEITKLNGENITITLEKV
jgi:isoleucyl-tRNA synthetase